MAELALPFSVFSAEAGSLTGDAGTVEWEALLFFFFPR